MTMPAKNPSGHTMARLNPSTWRAAGCSSCGGIRTGARSSRGWAGRMSGPRAGPRARVPGPGGHKVPDRRTAPGLGGPGPAGAGRRRHAEARPDVREDGATGKERGPGRRKAGRAPDSDPTGQPARGADARGADPGGAGHRRGGASPGRGRAGGLSGGIGGRIRRFGGIGWPVRPHTRGAPRDSPGRGTPDAPAAAPARGMPEKGQAAKRRVRGGGTSRWPGCGMITGSGGEPRGCRRTRASVKEINSHFWHRYREACGCRRTCTSSLRTGRTPRAPSHRWTAFRPTPCR